MATENLLANQFDRGAMRLVEARLREGKPVSPQLLEQYRKWKGGTAPSSELRSTQNVGQRSGTEPGQRTAIRTEKAKGPAPELGIVRESLCLDAAWQYADRGWPVFPVHTVADEHCSCGNADCSSPGKHPRTAHGVKDATTDPTRIRAWWQEWPGSNVAIATGTVS